MNATASKLTKPHVHGVREMKSDFWFIARPEPQKQNMFIRGLQQRCVEHFNPMITTSRRCGRGGMRTIREHFLRGYVPVRFKNPEQKTITEQTPGFQSLMRAGPERFIVLLENGIDLIRRLSQSTVEEAAQLPFKIGEFVRVLEGPFTGFSGEIEELTHQARMKVGIDLFGRTVPVELDPWQVEKDDIERDSRIR